MSRVWIERLRIVKMSVLPNLIYILNLISIKISTRCFRNVDQLSLRFTQRDKRPGIANPTWKEKEKAGSMVLLDFKTHSEATVLKTVWCG